MFGYVKENPINMESIVRELEELRQYKQTSEYINLCHKQRRKLSKNNRKEKIFTAKGYVCWNCDEDNKDILQLHHINHVADRPDLCNEVDNIIVLCSRCHSQFHIDCKRL